MKFNNIPYDIDNYSLSNIKKYLKDLSYQIRISKIFRKQKSNQKFKGFDICQVDKIRDLIEKEHIGACGLVETLSYNFRHFHIAYCEFRGKTREQIERKSRVSPQEYIIDHIKSQILRDMEKIKYDSNVCINS